MATPRKRLLLIDDDAKITTLLRDFFAERYEIDSADSGADGLAAALRHRPDVVLLDINMPGMSGLEVLRELRRVDEKLPVIMVTASTQLAEAEDALRNGAFAYLPKPFQLQYADHLVAAALTSPES